MFLYVFGAVLSFSLSFTKYLAVGRTCWLSPGLSIFSGRENSGSSISPLPYAPIFQNEL